MIVPIAIAVLSLIFSVTGKELEPIDYPISCYSCSWTKGQPDNTSCATVNSKTPKVACDGSCYYLPSTTSMERGCTWAKPYECALSHQGCCVKNDCNDAAYSPTAPSKAIICYTCSYDNDPRIPNKNASQSNDVSNCENPSERNTEYHSCDGMCSMRTMDLGYRRIYHRYCEANCNSDKEIIFGITYTTMCCGSALCTSSSPVTTMSSVSLLLLSLSYSAFFV